MPLTTVLLDVDGTLIDSNDAHASAWIDTFVEFGFEIPFSKVRDLIGKGGDKLLPETIGVEQDSTLGKELGTRRSAVFRERYLPTLRPFPGARELLERLRSDGIVLVVATSAQEDELADLLAQAGVADLIEERTSASDVERSKPDPDIVQAALDRSGADPDEAIMIGDTPYDVEASTRAGVRVIALRCGGWSDDDLAAATAIYDDTADLLANYTDSPIGQRIGSAA